MELGRIGVWTSYRTIGADNAGEAAQLVEELGYGTFWLGGSPEPDQLRPLLAATDRIVAATGIVNVWQSEAESVARQHAALTADYPGRVLLGVGIGHPEATSDYTRPLTAMRAFIDGLDAADSPVPATERCIAALSPKMLELSRDRSWGTHPYFVPVEHSRYAREHVGDRALVATELACVLDSERDRARETARAYAKLYLSLTNYTRNLLRFGFTEDDIANGGSDRLIDAVVPQGSAEEIAAVVHAHLAAGADHVCLQPITGHAGIPAGEWRALAAALELG